MVLDHFEQRDVARRRIVGVVAVTLAAMALHLPRGAAATSPTKSATIPNVVRVHGAFADGSSWDKVIAVLRGKGIHVIAVQNQPIDAGNRTSQVLADRRVELGAE